MRVIILATLLFFIATPVLAADTETKQNKMVSAKEVYELSERCAKLAAENFKQRYGEDAYQSLSGLAALTVARDGSTSATIYTNHFNKNLNTCFMLITTDAVSKDEKTKIITKSLVDIMENDNEIATLIFKYDPLQVVICTVKEQACISQSDWDSLVKPYMEE